MQMGTGSELRLTVEIKYTEENERPRTEGKMNTKYPGGSLRSLNWCAKRTQVPGGGAKGW